MWDLNNSPEYNYFIHNAIQTITLLWFPVQCSGLLINLCVTWQRKVLVSALAWKNRAQTSSTSIPCRYDGSIRHPRRRFLFKAGFFARNNKTITIKQYGHANQLDYEKATARTYCETVRTPGLASSPGHSQLFIVAREKREGLVCEIMCVTSSLCNIPCLKMVTKKLS